MQAFQSWADIVIMLVLAIAYIITFIVQKNQIKALKETSKAHAELTQSQSVHIGTYKNLFKPEELESFIKMKVELKLEDSSKIIKEKEKKVQESEEEIQAWVVLYTDTVWALYGVLRSLDGMAKNETRLEFVTQFCQKSNLTTLEVFKFLDKKFENVLPEIKKSQS